MAFGLGVLRLSSDAFWRMTPRELRYAADGVHGPRGAPLTAETLGALLRAFPD